MNSKLFDLNLTCTKLNKQINKYFIFNISIEKSIFFSKSFNYIIKFFFLLVLFCSTKKKKKKKKKKRQKQKQKINKQKKSYLKMKTHSFINI